MTVQNQSAEKGTHPLLKSLLLYNLHLCRFLVAQES